MTSYTVTPEQVSAAKLQLVLDKAAGRVSSAWTRSVADAKPSHPVEPERAPEKSDAAERHTIKGNPDSMMYHTSDGPHYDQTDAEVWFTDEESAKEAGYKHWNHRKR